MDAKLAACKSVPYSKLDASVLTGLGQLPFSRTSGVERRRVAPALLHI